MRVSREANGLKNAQGAFDNCSLRCSTSNIHVVVRFVAGVLGDARGVGQATPLARRRTGECRAATCSRTRAMDGELAVVQGCIWPRPSPGAAWHLSELSAAAIGKMKSVRPPTTLLLKNSPPPRRPGNANNGAQSQVKLNGCDL